MAGCGGSRAAAGFDAAVAAGFEAVPDGVLHALAFGDAPDFDFAAVDAGDAFEAVRRGRQVQAVRADAELLAPYMEEGRTSVGTLVDIAHVSASPVGSEVVCRVEVVEVDRARVRFKVSVTDDFGDVGTGFHERFVVSSEKFMQKASSKLS